MQNTRSIKATEITRGMRIVRGFCGDTWRVLAARPSSAGAYVMVDVEDRSEPLAFRASATVSVLS